MKQQKFDLFEMCYAKLIYLTFSQGKGTWALSKPTKATYETPDKHVVA